MNFLKTFVTSSLGASIGMTAYLCVADLITYGSCNLFQVTSLAWLIGSFFGACFAITHTIVKLPTLLSSNATAGCFVAVALVISLYAGTFAGFSALSIAALVASTLVLGTGGYITNRLLK